MFVSTTYALNFTGILVSESQINLKLFSTVCVRLLYFKMALSPTNDTEAMFTVKAAILLAQQIQLCRREQMIVFLHESENPLTGIVEAALIRFLLHLHLTR